MGKKRGSTVARGAKNKKDQQQKQRQGRLAALKEFLRGVRNELKRVNWPNRDQLRQSTTVVLIVVVTLALYVAAWDFVWRNLARLIFL